MFVEVSHIPTIVAEFVTTVVMPKAPTGLMKFGIGFVSPYIRDAVAARVDQYMPTLKMLGIVTEEGRWIWTVQPRPPPLRLRKPAARWSLAATSWTRRTSTRSLKSQRNLRSIKEIAMDVKDMRKMQGERTEEELLARIDKILDDARDGHYDLTSTDINDLCEAWECIKHIRTVLAMDR